MYQYSVAYYAHPTSRRVVHRTVVAHDADDARERVRAIDPRFIATVKSPRRGKAVVEAGK